MTKYLSYTHMSFATLAMLVICILQLSFVSATVSKRLRTGKSVDVPPLNFFPNLIRSSLPESLQSEVFSFLPAKITFTVMMHDKGLRPLVDMMKDFTGTGSAGEIIENFWRLNQEDIKEALDREAVEWFWAATPLVVDQECPELLEASFSGLRDVGDEHLNNLWMN